MKRSKFNLSHPHSLTCDMGYLVPCCLIDTLPNDSFYIKSKAFIRVQPMLAPIMHMINVYTQFWYVPYRLLWEEWETFITGGQTGDEDISLTFPYILAPETTGFKVGSLADYFGYPIGQPLIEVSAMPHRAMALIYNTRYRDEDLQEDIPISFESGLDTVTSTELLRPSWKKDAWTTARPWTQRGAEVSVPVNTGLDNTKALVKSTAVLSSLVYSRRFSIRLSNMRIPDVDGGFTYGIGTTNTNFNIVSLTLPKALLETLVFQGNEFSLNNEVFTMSSEAITSKYSWSSTMISSRGISISVSGVVDKVDIVAGAAVQPFSVSVSFTVTTSDRGVGTDLEIKSITLKPNVSIDDAVYNTYTLASGSIAIRDLRTASAMQRYAERSAKYGNRYEEFIQREFGVSPKDSRIQRPEHIGSGKGNLTFSEVLQTSEGDQTQVGSMYGHGVGGINSRGIFFHAPEHGVIIGLLSIRPKSIYGQGIDRAWLKRNKLDFFLPEFAHIGMQEVYQQELMATKDNKGVVFGYQDRNYEYRSMQPKICGEFRDTLDFWNMARKFEQPPVLNSSFITMNPTKRIFGVTDQNTHSLLCMVQNDIIAKRCVPKRAVDKLI